MVIPFFKLPKIKFENDKYGYDDAFKRFLAIEKNEYSINSICFVLHLIFKISICLSFKSSFKQKSTLLNSGQYIATSRSEYFNVNI